MQCPNCQSRLTPGGGFCASCGSEVDWSSLPTELDGTPPPQTPVSVPDSGELVAGQVLAERYRIVGRLGKGGMGAVYRADDLRLGQPVALKFLSAELAGNPQVHDRFLQEVRVARQISHPNVCRVHDIGEIDGRPYLSMEYIDGEDLASLLRRIGRLPKDKAVEIAQQLCGGLAAAHAQGMLHRDLKPANVMLDGRGQVKITDFGLAGFVEELTDIRSGTPAYMAPEQLAGREVSVQSDLYSLGLVLYEVFTGKPAFRADSLADLQTQQQSAPTNPSTIVDDIDGAAERIILRCMEHDPAQRPESALAVAAGLPGGDPLAAALAAGELPTPEMVAAAGEEGTLAPRSAVLLLASVVAAFALVVFWLADQQLVRTTPHELSRDVLTDRARQLLATFGDREAPVDDASGFSYDGAFIRWSRERLEGKERWDPRRPERAQPIVFWYRDSPAPLQPRADIFRRISTNDPPFNESGMASLRLDLQGRLLRLEVQPKQRLEPPPPAGEPDWSPLFEAAQIDPATLGPAEPLWSPDAVADLRRAWTGPHPRFDDVELRVEAAAFGGSPVYFHTIGPWTSPSRDEHAGPGTQQIVQTTILLLTLGVSGVLARRNWKAGRGDRRGAFRLAATATLFYTAVWLLRAHHPIGQGAGALPPALWSGVIVAGGFALFISLLVWTLYMALEPAIRRRQPELIVSWTRLLAGKLRDPLVGRDTLIGMAAGGGLSIALYGALEVGKLLGEAAVSPGTTWLDPLLGVRHALARFLFNFPDTALGGMLVALLWFVFVVAARFLVRAAWPGSVLIFGLLLLSTRAQMSSGSVFAWTFAAIAAALVTFVLVRFGLLPLLVVLMTSNLLLNLSIPPGLDVWWAAGPLLVIALFLAIGAWAFTTALGRQKLGAL